MIRRLLSFALFAAGGLLLVSEMNVAWVAQPEMGWVKLGALAVIGVPAAGLLALAARASPGNRFAETGLAVLIAAGAGGLFGVMMIFAMSMGGELESFDFAAGGINFGAIAGCGWWLRRRGRESPKDRIAHLEQVFGEG